MSRLDERHLSDLLHIAASQAPSATGIGQSAIQLGKRKVRRRRIVWGGLAAAGLVTASLSIAALQRDERIEIIPAGPAPTSVNCSDLAGREGGTSGSPDYVGNSGTNLPPQEQAARWASGSGFAREFPDAELRTFSDEKDKMTVVYVDRAGKVRAILAYSRVADGWQLLSVRAC